jgi:hypothetical protein
MQVPLVLKLVLPAVADGWDAAMEIMLNPNDSEIKILWRTDNGPLAAPLKVHKDYLHECTKGVRAALSGINEYIARNPHFSEERDPGWDKYGDAVRALREAGRRLYNGLFDQQDDEARALLQALDELPIGGALNVHCADDETTIPLGFVYPHFPGASRILSHDVPSRDDFSGFWLNRFNITMLLAGSGCSQKVLMVDPDLFRLISILHQADAETAREHFGEDSARELELLDWLADKKHHYDWNILCDDCRDKSDWNNVFFVLAHSDGSCLELEKAKIDCVDFANILRRNAHKDRAQLLLLNCCMSVTGGKDKSLLSSVAQRGVCGLIGTEAKVLNTHALRCGARLMWHLCVEGLPLGAAFDEMQRAEDLFPINLFYTCYAQRSFQLLRPLHKQMAA